VPEAQITFPPNTERPQITLYKPAGTESTEQTPETELRDKEESQEHLSRTGASETFGMGEFTDTGWARARTETQGGGAETGRAAERAGSGRRRHPWRESREPGMRAAGRVPRKGDSSSQT